MSPSYNHPETGKFISAETAAQLAAAGKPPKGWKQPSATEEGNTEMDNTQIPPPARRNIRQWYEDLSDKRKEALKALGVVALIFVAVVIGALVYLNWPKSDETQVADDNQPPPAAAAVSVDAIRALSEGVVANAEANRINTDLNEATRDIVEDLNGRVPTQDEISKALEAAIQAREAAEAARDRAAEEAFENIGPTSTNTAPPPAPVPTGETDVALNNNTPAGATPPEGDLAASNPADSNPPAQTAAFQPDGQGGGWWGGVYYSSCRLAVETAILHGLSIPCVMADEESPVQTAGDINPSTDEWTSQDEMELQSLLSRQAESL